MAKQKVVYRDRPKGKKRRRLGGMKIPLSIAVALGATIAVPPKAGWAAPYEVYRIPVDAGKSLILGWTGIHADTGKFDSIPLYPLILGAGALVHKVVGGMLGVNAVLGRYKVPLIRV